VSQLLQTDKTAALVVALVALHITRTAVAVQHLAKEMLVAAQVQQSLVQAAVEQVVRVKVVMVMVQT
jgi:hypothetical protein